MEHKIIGGALLSLCYVTLPVLGGVYGGRVLATIPPRKFMLLPLVWAALLVLLGVGQYSLDGYMSDGKISVRSLLFHNLPVYGMFMSAWVSAHWHWRQSVRR